MTGPMESIRQAIATHNVISPVGAEVMESFTGRYRGETVTSTSEASKLTDAAEELGMSVSHRADKRTLGQRQVRQGQGTDLESLARIADYYDRLPDMPREIELANLVEKLKSFEDLLSGRGGGGGARPTKEDLLAALQEFDRDVTHQYAALEIAREYFEQAGVSSEFQTLLDQASAEYERGEIAQDVRAGFAAADIANRAAATLETDPATLRDTYRSMLREKTNLGQLFDQLSKFDLLKNFNEVIDTFMTAAGRDLASTGPSVDETHLHGLLTELSKLKQMKTVFEQSKDLVRQVARLMDPSDVEKMDETSLTSRILNFAAKTTVNLADARALLGGLEEGSPQAQVVLANGLRDLHTQIPDTVMPSHQARQQQVSTLMSLLNNLVAAEEDFYESVARA